MAFKSLSPFYTQYRTLLGDLAEPVISIVARNLVSWFLPMNGLGTQSLRPASSVADCGSHSSTLPLFG